jgi:hypothetical protein
MAKRFGPKDPSTRHTIDYRKSARGVVAPARHDIAPSARRVVGQGPVDETVGQGPAPAPRPTYGSTFSGIGGLDLAVGHVFGAEPLWHVEPDPYAAAVLRRHWPHVPNLHRIELVDGSAPRPNILCGGSPCQDLSLAGQGAGLDGERSGLWWELARVLRQLDPEIFIWENVAAAVARALPAVLRTLVANPSSPTCTAWLWQPNPSTWCWLVKSSDGRIVADHATGPGAAGVATGALAAAFVRLGCSDSQTLVLAPWEVPHA